DRRRGVGGMCPAGRGAPVPGGARGVRAPGAAAGTADAERAAATARAEVERLFRSASGAAVATLARTFGDLDVAEDLVQEAFAVALERWPRTGPPPNPPA